MREELLCEASTQQEAIENYRSLRGAGCSIPPLQRAEAVNCQAGGCVQVMLAAVTENCHHVRNLIQVSSSSGPQVPSLLWLYQSPWSDGGRRMRIKCIHCPTPAVTSAQFLLVRTVQMTSLSCKESWEVWFLVDLHGSDSAL